MDLHFREERVYSPQSPKKGLLESLKERYPTTMELYKQAETAEENELYYLEGVAYIKTFEDVIENYLAIKNSSRNEFLIRNKCRILSSRICGKLIGKKCRFLLDVNNKIDKPSERG